MASLASPVVYLEDHMLFPTVTHSEWKRKTRRTRHARSEAFLVQSPTFQRFVAQGLPFAILTIHGENTLK